jgi:hypothetical protein
MALDLDAITARLRQASRVEPPPARPLVPPPVTGPASRQRRGRQPRSRLPLRRLRAAS